MKQIGFPQVALLLFALSPVMAQVQDGRPIADAGSSRYAGPDPVVLDGTRSYDPDDSGPLSCTWRQISGPPVIIIDSNTVTPTIAGFIKPSAERDPTPLPGGFTQTNEVQECEFELVVNDGQTDSQPDIVKVRIVPDFGDSQLQLYNEAFDPNKPTIIYFGGGDCIVGYTNPRLPFESTEWTSKANIVWFPDGYGPDPSAGDRRYYRYGDMLIVYLSDVAPEYKERIQTSGWSTGGQPAIDVGIRLNLTYQDPRYAVNHVTLLDAAQYCRDYTNDIPTYLSSSVDGELCFVDNNISTLAENYFTDPKSSFPLFHKNVLNVVFDQYQNSSIGWLQQHYLGNDWYGDSLFNSTALEFNQGIIGGAYWSVIGPGRNLQLSSTNNTITYQFKWYGSRSSGYMECYDELNHPGRLPEPVTLLDPIEVADSNGFILTCEESENAVGYELLFGTDPYRVMDYDIISDTPTPPNHTITTIPYDKTWWTIRVRDQHGSTIYADPICLVANNPNPADGAVLIDTWMNLSWNEGIRAASYNVYFGENYVDVQEGTPEVFRGNQTLTYFTVGLAGFPYPNGFVLGTTYFWRIDDVEANGTVIHQGNVWSFTIADYLIVDDFESYTDDEAAGEAIYQTWIDGFGIADNGAQVGYLLRPYCEQTIVHGGSQSMPLLYVNEAGATNSEATLTLTSLRDWTQAGVAGLSLWFQGDSANAAEPLYVAVSSSAGTSAVVTHDDASAATVRSWVQWRIPLQAFADLGINLTDMDRLAIGLGSKGGIALGGSGTMYIDDIRLYVSPPEIVASWDDIWIAAKAADTITP